MQFRQRPTSSSSLALPLDTLLTGGYGEIALRNRTPVLEPEGHWTRGRSVGAARSQRAGRSPRLNVRPEVASPKADFLRALRFSGLPPAPAGRPLLEERGDSLFRVVG